MQACSKRWARFQKISPQNLYFGVTQKNKNKNKKKKKRKWFSKRKRKKVIYSILDFCPYNFNFLTFYFSIFIPFLFLFSSLPLSFLLYSLSLTTFPSSSLSCFPSLSVSDPCFPTFSLSPFKISPTLSKGQRLAHLAYTQLRHRS